MHFFASFTNYATVGGDPAAVAGAQRLIDADFVKVLDAIDKVRECVGGEPVVSKLGMITNITAKATKRRLILDCKVSGCSANTTQWGRSILPRVADVIQDALYLQSMCRSGEEVAYMVLDMQDAFWLIPLLATERKYFGILWRQVRGSAQGGPRVAKRAANIRANSRAVRQVLAVPLLAGRPADVRVH